MNPPLAGILLQALEGILDIKGSSLTHGQCTS